MDSNYYNDRWSPQVREGDLLMFPSYLSTLCRVNQIQHQTIQEYQYHLIFG